MSNECKNCGKPLLPMSTFCRACGALTGVQGAEPTQIVHVPRSDNNSPWVKVGTHFRDMGTAPVMAARVSSRQAQSIIDVAQTLRPSASAFENQATVVSDGDSTRIVRKTHRFPLRGWLVAVAGPHWGESWVVRVGKNTIGRSNDANVSLKEDSVSSVHAVLWVNDDDVVTLVDRDSSNGTFVNQSQIFTAQRLEDGDLLRLGEIVVLQWVNFNMKVPQSRVQG